MEFCFILSHVTFSTAEFKQFNEEMLEFYIELFYNERLQRF